MFPGPAKAPGPGNPAPRRLGSPRSPRCSGRGRQGAPRPLPARRMSRPNGRPRTDPAARRSRTTRLYLTAAEHAVLAARARRAKTTLSSYLRCAGLGLPIPTPIPEANRTLAGDLGRLAVNLNQIAHHLNLGLPLNAGELRGLLRQILGTLAGLKSSLLP